MLRSGLQVIDGGLATELSRQGMDLSDDLWSARVLLDAPEAIERVHAEYYRAGADIAITASYQASYDGFAARGLSAERTTAVLRRSVELAQAARTRVLREQPGITRELLVAASVGPYGAVRHDGSEYRGDYALDEAALVDFHRARFSVLADAGADLLACETIPSRTEAAALVRLLRERPAAKAWVTFSCRDGRHTAAGDAIAECARWLDGVPQVVAVGVNCVAPEWVESLIGEIKSGTGKPIVVYPNSGETWDADARCWRGEADRFTAYVSRWPEAGARWIGGCCRTTPEDIRTVRAAVDAFGERSDRTNLRTPHSVISSFVSCVSAALLGGAMLLSPHRVFGQSTVRADSSADVRAIVASRARSNAAIARHDTAGIAREMMPGVTVVSSTSAMATGVPANVSRMAEQFARRPDTRWVRTPDSIAVFDAWGVASERGHWVGTWTESDGPVVIRGSYEAQWRREDGRWRIQGELFVPLRCEGGAYCRVRPQ